MTSKRREELMRKMPEFVVAIKKVAADHQLSPADCMFGFGLLGGMIVEGAVTKGVGRDESRTILAQEFFRGMGASDVQLVASEDVPDGAPAQEGVL